MCVCVCLSVCLCVCVCACAQRVYLGSLTLVCQPVYEKENSDFKAVQKVTLCGILLGWRG